MVTVSEIITQIDFNDVFLEYRRHYDEEHRKRIREVFQRLKEAIPSANYYHMILFIRAIKENEFGEDVIIDVFDCNDTSVFFDVYGKDDDYDGIYSIASSTYEDLMGYFVSDDTLAKFNSAQIISHILWALEW